MNYEDDEVVNGLKINSYSYYPKDFPIFANE